MFFSFEHFSFHHRISGQCFNPYCSSENLFYSSTDQTFLSMSGGHWSLRWTCGTTTLHNQHYFSCNKDKRKCSTLHLRSLWSFKRQFVCNICLDVDSNQCGQTSRPVVRTEIQTCCNIKASSCSYNLYLVNWFFSWNNPFVESWYLSTRSHCYCHTFSGNFVFLLHDDPPKTTTSTDTSTKPFSPATSERRKDSTEHSKIQKDSF